MFSFNYEKRLATWSKFREQLETSKDPLQDVIDFYKHCPQVSRHTDPYDPEVWPNPWELIHENEYCDYCIILAMCYTLQLTERFSGDTFEIHIGIDKGNTRHIYLLVVGDRVLGYDPETHVHKDEAFAETQSQVTHQMRSGQ
jgi:hypothetical protein